MSAEERILLDQFAKEAMGATIISIMREPDRLRNFLVSANKEAEPIIAEMAYAVAVAMLKERQKHL